MGISFARPEPARSPEQRTEREIGHREWNEETTMTNTAARKQARRFYGTMGAAMRRTTRWLEARRDERIDATIRRSHGYPEDRCVGLARELMAR
jgi:hypothetical protein